MKTFVLCSVILSAACGVSTLHAQSVSVSPIQHSGSSTYMPAQYASDSIPCLISASFYAGDGSAEVSVYDENLDQVGQVNMPPLPVRGRYEIATVDEFEFDSDKIEATNFSDCYKNELHVYIVEWLRNAEYRIEERDEYTYLIPDSISPETYEGDWVFFHYDVYGEKYPARALCIKGYENDIMEVSMEDWSRCYIPTHWGVPELQHEDTYLPPYSSFYMEDFNSGTDNIGNVILTQTLFNSDADFEYISPIAELKLSTHEEDIYTYYTYDVVLKGFRIMNANGNELQSIEFPDSVTGSVVSVVVIGSKTYLMASVSGDNGPMYLYYNVEREDNNSRVNTIPVAIHASVEPTIVREGEPVNVNLRDTSAESGLTVTDMGGRTIYSTLLHSDGTYQIPGTVMRRGMNIVTVTPDGHAPVSTKVLVK